MDIIDKLPAAKRLMRQLHQIPYFASKNMNRILAYFLQLDKAKSDQLCQALQEVKMSIVACSSCFAWKQKNQSCLFCDDTSRDDSIICVVETWQDLLVIERTETYKGRYHVLGGAICPLDGIGPQDLQIDSLINRVSDNVTEVVLAMNYTPEGEATSAFIARKLEAFSVKVSSLAKGVPIGSNLEFIDRLTIGKAISERKPF